MSLKAKIEAVIYASEEPVTLAQLMGLLSGEAQAELDALQSQQQSLALLEEPPNSELPEPEAGDPEAGDPDALNAETLGDTEAEEPSETEAATSKPEADSVALESDEALASDTPALSLTASSIEQAPDVLSPDDGADAAVGVADGKAAAAEAKARERKLREYFREVLDRLIADYANNDRGLEIREVAGGFRLGTKPEYHDAVRGFVKSLKPPLKLSLQALETLAVVAYKQPVTAPEVSEIRGVDSGGVLGGLMTRKLVTTAGRKQVIGRPILYKTTKEFLVRFGLKDINELPSIEEFEKMAGELADTEPLQEEIPMEGSPRGNVSEEAVQGSSGESGAVDELNAVPEPTNNLHESVEEMVSDKSYSPEGVNTEPADPHDVEPMRDVHEAQADGIPDTDSDNESGAEYVDKHEPYTGDDEKGA